MKSTFLRYALASTLCLSTHAAHADIVTIQFGGYLRDILIFDWGTFETVHSLRTDLLGPTMAVNDEFYGTLVIDTSLPLESTDGIVAQYDVAGSSARLSLRNVAGTLEYTSAASRRFWVRNSTPGGGHDAVNYGTDGMTNLGLFSETSFNFIDYSGRGLDSTAIPGDYNLQTFPTSNVVAVFQAPNAPFEVSLNTTITSLQVSVVPEPAAWALLASGLGVFGLGRFGYSRPGGRKIFKNARTTGASSSVV